ncbi:MAG: peptidoglycan DD-metalloendopeptidase family protein [Acidimicrobiales bacterium]|nr:peptidoglycan DD-metalloendopeptidase family protein [Acidimicrobiales bacterium]
MRFVIKFRTLITCCLTISLFSLIFVSSAGSQESEEVDSIEQAKQEREEAREQELAAGAEIALLEAEDIDVVAALDAATSLVYLQEAKEQAAQQRLDSALNEKVRAQEDFLEIAEEITLLEKRAVAYAVESYLGLSDQRAEAWFEADDATTAAHKIALLDFVSSDARDVLDKLKLIQDSRDELLSSAAVAEKRADVIRVELEEVRVDLEAKKKVQEELKEELNARRVYWNTVLSSAVREQEDITDFIVAEEERIARELEEARRQAELDARLGQISEGGWVWPAAGNVGSGFGMRLHPILGYSRMHNGLDVGCSMGDPIWSATEGIVTIAESYGGYGNAIVVQHANSTASLYAHLTGFNVNVDQYVFTGDQIGTCGTTGLSTGPHLHFEIRLSGTPVDPRPYLP